MIFRKILLINALGFMASDAVSIAPKILVLGGTGFIGSTVSRLAINSGFQVTSLSRRGTPASGSPSDVEGVTWIQGDATDPSVVERVINEGQFDGVVHAIGMLFAGRINRFASGSGSIPDPGTTYDKITRQTAFSATAAFRKLSDGGAEGQRRPFVFVSAAEAKWSFDGVLKGTPVGWLHDYLIAKRAAEDELLKNSPSLRGVVMRPSLVWTMDRPSALLPVAAFQVGSRLGLPFVDRPVHVETLASAIVESLLNSTVHGVQDWRNMEELSAKYSTVHPNEGRATGAFSISREDGARATEL